MRTATEFTIVLGQFVLIPPLCLSVCLAIFYSTAHFDLHYIVVRAPSMRHNANRDLIQSSEIEMFETIANGKDKNQGIIK